jgi:hypothetical protein
MNGSKILSIIFVLCLFDSAQGQDDFGRFYTTPRQRADLEELRQKRPRDDIIIEVASETIPDEDTDNNIENIIDSISLNGLVYRTDGKNTAWINRSSTSFGSIENQYTLVQEKDVDPDRVKISLPDETNTVRLKVGQQYDVMTRQVYDVINDPLNPRPVIIPGDTNRSR